MIITYNRKVLVHERKKHTAHRVASDLAWGRATYVGRGEGYLPWGTPSLTRLGEGGWVFTFNGGVPTFDGGRLPTLGYPSPLS